MYYICITFSEVRILSYMTDRCLPDTWLGLGALLAVIFYAAAECTCFQFAVGPCTRLDRFDKHVIADMIEFCNRNVTLQDARIFNHADIDTSLVWTQDKFSHIETSINVEMLVAV